MKILHFIYAAGVRGGAEKYLKFLLPGLKQEGVDCHLLISCPLHVEAVLQEYSTQFNSIGIKAHVIGAERTSFLSVANKLAAYCKENGIKVVHSHLSNSDLIAVLAKKFFNKNLFIVSTKHGYEESYMETYQPESPVIKKNLYYHVTKFILRNIDRNIAVSRGIANLYKNIGLTKEDFPVIYHGIKIPEFNKEDYAAECRQSIPQLIMVGRLQEFKGHKYLVEAMSIVAKQKPAVKLLILGEGANEDNIRRQIQNAGLETQIEIAGFKEFPSHYIANSDVIILPSLFEPFGLVYLEAFALKVPVIAFNTPAGNELMEHGKTGLMAPKRDAAAIAQHILYLLDNEAERKRIAENAYKHYIENFTTDHMVKNTANWYQKEIPTSLLS